MERLSAKSNEKIKFAVSVRDSSSVRNESGLFFLEGARLCSDAVEYAPVFRAFFTSSALKKYADKCEKILSVAQESYEISDEIAQKMSDTKNSQGVFCVCRFPQAQQKSLTSGGKYIMLENVQDPSNLGAVCRTAEALGIDGMIVCGGCDIYNPKALRASMGSALRLNIINCNDIKSFIDSARKNGFLTLASTPSADSEPVSGIDMSGSVICIVGNEGNGITEETMALCDKKITIPMGGRAESLNASTAAAILIWEMVRK